jgi:putative DNA primase/helicase
LIFTMEDDPADTLVPRLLAMGADLTKIRVIGYSDKLEDDAIDFIHDEIRSIRPRLVFFDPIIQYLDTCTDNNSAPSIRKFLSELAGIFDEVPCAMVLLRHIAKGESRLETAGAGSHQYNAFVRSACRIAKAPHDPDLRVFHHFKSNVAALGDDQLFRIVPGDVPTIEFLGPPACGRFDADEITAADQGAQKGRKAPRRNSAKELIKEMLANGPVDGRKIKKLARLRDISPSTLRKAREQLGVGFEYKGCGKEKRAFWTLDKPPKRRRRRRKSV